MEPIALILPQVNPTGGPAGRLSAVHKQADSNGLAGKARSAYDGRRVWI